MAGVNRRDVPIPERMEKDRRKCQYSMFVSLDKETGESVEGK